MAGGIARVLLRQEFNKLNFYYYMSLKKAVFKPAVRSSVRPSVRSFVRSFVRCVVAALMAVCPCCLSMPSTACILPHGQQRTTNPTKHAQAFFKGIILPMCEAGDCTLKETAIICSVLVRSLRVRASYIHACACVRWGRVCCMPTGCTHCTYILPAIRHTHFSCGNVSRMRVVGVVCILCGDVSFLVSLFCPLLLLFTRDV